ncbi:hypothetical protein [Amycolatopsis albispora]|uniref:Uncharacterized protein n=1 Tax=Amycolatopsis albispora TaxID=1804986 RepID=A0A344LEG7_9PSEU|nr:hypothetical protein [Amycolatopsis albispora]AXB46441.1 hypothetical protein A4R43_31585 [Amycolatopsis albispora]
MSEPEDPERLLAEALRAQAVRAPQPARQAEPVAEPPTQHLAAPSFPAPAGYGLLSGADAGSLERERAALEPPAPSPEPSVTATRQAEAPAPIAAWWVLLLAVLLGLAAGAVAGLLTLL